MKARRRVNDKERPFAGTPPPQAPIAIEILAFQTYHRDMSPLSRTFHIQTFGCQMNAADSEWFARVLEARGFAPASFEEAGFHILNTCSVRDKPEQKVYSELGRIARFCKVHGKRDVTVCVGGCVAQQVGAALAKRFPQVRLVFGTDGIARAPEAVSRLAENPLLRLALLDFEESYTEREDPRLDADMRNSPAVRTPPAAFVNIMQGCDNFCTYCIVPFVRGRQKSRAPGAVLAECRALAAAGAREITLLGQNVNSYGQDRDDCPPFPHLLREVAAIPGIERLRFVTSHPKDIAPELIEAFAGLDVLCPRLHLPLQSGSDRILKAMNRRYDTARYLDIVAQLRAARPDIMLTTDIIVGFPGETEEDFQATMRLMDEVGFVSAFSFVYSDRPGARAALLPGKIKRSVALERLFRLQEQQNQASEKVLTSMTGSSSVILLEGKSRMSDPPGTDEEPQAPEDASNGGADAAEYWQGRTPQGFIVNVALEADGRNMLGAMLPVRIDSAARHSLKGSQAGEPW